MDFIQQNCPVCWNSIDFQSNNFCITACNHSFHLSCFAKSIACKNYNCPICRALIIEHNDVNMLTRPEEEEDIENEAGVENEADQSDISNTETNFITGDILNKLENHLHYSDINYKNLIELICYLEHEEFEDKIEFQIQADFIFGKFRQILNSADPNNFVA